VKYCCAIANCGGGKFVLGITNNRPRKVVGSHLTLASRSIQDESQPLAQAVDKRLTSGKEAVEPSDRKKQITEFIIINGKATSSQLSEYTGLTQVRVRAILKELVDCGTVTKVSDNRYAYYIINGAATSP